MTLRILSDFDGVWTDQTAEAERVLRCMTEEAARLAGAEPGAARAQFQAFAERVRRAPTEFGWSLEGRITAFADEDPFCVANAIANYLDRADDDPDAARYRAAILDGDDADLHEFGERCFFEGSAAWRAENEPSIARDAAQVVARLAELDCELVVVSNSLTTKLVEFFAAVDVQAGEGPGHAVRVHGDARKHVFGDVNHVTRFGPRDVCVDRPLYERVLVAERADLVIGDVFSLDLALPHHLRDQSRPGAPRHLVLRRHVHTPAWTHGLVEENVIDHAVDHVRELPALVERLLEPPDAAVPQRPHSGAEA